MTMLTIISLVILLAGLVFCVTGIRKLFQRQLIIGAGRELTGLVLLLVAGFMFLVSSSLYTYQRLVYEAPVAEIEFQQLAVQHFRVELNNLQSGEQRFFELLGDEWQLDAQILSWRGYANLLGLDTYFRLHRLSGRYVHIEQERELAHSVHSLATDNTFDIWRLIFKYQGWFKLVDAMYGSAVFLPMTDRATYRISISRNGLVARPDNDVAKRAVSHWIGR